MYIAMNQAMPELQKVRGASGDQVGDRLRRDRQEHHAEDLDGAAVIPAQGLPGALTEQPFKKDVGEGQATAG